MRFGENSGAKPGRPWENETGSYELRFRRPYFRPIQVCWFFEAETLVFFHAACPIFTQNRGFRNLQRTDDSEAEKLRIGVVPDAFGQLRILLFPGRTGSPPRRAPKCGRIIIPTP